MKLKTNFQLFMFLPQQKSKLFLLKALYKSLQKNTVDYKYVAGSFLLFLFSLNTSAATYPSPYDIVYHRISITVDPGTSGAISNGSVTTYFKTTAAAVNKIGFDLNQSMTISSVVYHGSSLTAANYPQASNAVIITLPSSIAIKGTLDSITVYYSGTPIGPGSPVPSGYNFSLSAKSIYTLGESFTGSTWWPCHDSLTDKIDSVDLIVKTPSAYRAAGNGIVTEVISGANRICTWKTRYRIATYMVNFAAANYVDYVYNITTGGKILPVHNYLYAADNTSTYKTGVDFIQSILPVYVSLFNSDYPFLNEKYGIADCYGSWGALEVQSMTFCGTGNITSNSVLAHELAHQWFADKLTTNDWHQIWLNEGFAQFCESIIYPENLQGAATAASKRSSLKSSVSTTSTTYVSNISSAQTIFASSSSLYQPYEKGAMLLSMLRSWLGDPKFFTALHNYLGGPGIAYDFTSTDSLQKYMQAQTVNDLSGFFPDWINQKGTVKYAVKYQYVTNGVYFQLVQSPTSAGAGYFDMPVPLEVKNSSGLDTTITVIDRNGVLYNSQTGQTYGSNTIYFPLSALPAAAPVFDPNNNVLAVSSSITSSATLSNNIIILPVKNFGLKATRYQDNTKLGWSVESDETVESVIIEKSYDSKNFSSINIVNLQSVATGKYKGEYYDYHPDNGIVYYRLKVIGANGRFSYSAIERVNNALTGQVKLSPNPVKNSFVITLPSSFINNSTQLTVRIYNIEGKLVQQKSTGIVTTQLPVECSLLHKGIYNVIIENENQQQVQTDFLKQ